MACARQPCPEHTVCPQDPATSSTVEDIKRIAKALYYGEIADRLDVVLATMRKDGQGLSSDQILTIRRGLGLTVL